MPAVLFYNKCNSCFQIKHFSHSIINHQHFLSKLKTNTFHVLPPAVSLTSAGKRKEIINCRPTVYLKFVEQSSHAYYLVQILSELSELSELLSEIISPFFYFSALLPIYWIIWFVITNFHVENRVLLNGAEGSIPPVIPRKMYLLKLSHIKLKISAIIFYWQNWYLDTTDYIL